MPCGFWSRSKDNGRDSAPMRTSGDPWRPSGRAACRPSPSPLTIAPSVDSRQRPRHSCSNRAMPTRHLLAHSVSIAQNIVLVTDPDVSPTFQDCHEEAPSQACHVALPIFLANAAALFVPPTGIRRQLALAVCSAMHFAMLNVVPVPVVKALLHKGRIHVHPEEINPGGILRAKGIGHRGCVCG
jgi:hypothetical protein